PSTRAPSSPAPRSSRSASPRPWWARAHAAAWTTDSGWSWRFLRDGKATRETEPGRTSSQATHRSHRPRGPRYNGPDPARDLLEPPDRRRQRAGGGAPADVVYVHRSRGGRSLSGRLRPPRLHGRPSGDGHARSHQLHGAGDETLPRRVPARDAPAGRRPDHERP